MKKSIASVLALIFSSSVLACADFNGTWTCSFPGQDDDTTTVEQNGIEFKLTWVDKENSFEFTADGTPRERYIEVTDEEGNVYQLPIMLTATCPGNAVKVEQQSMTPEYPFTVVTTWNKTSATTIDSTVSMTMSGRNDTDRGTCTLH